MDKFIYFEDGVDVKIGGVDLKQIVSKKRTDKCFLIVVKEHGINVLDKDGTLTVGEDQFVLFFPILHKFIKNLSNRKDISKCIEEFASEWSDKL